MQVFSTLSGAAVLLALMPSVMALGKASVYNNCGSTVYYKTVSTSEQGWQTVPGGGVHEPYSAEGQGVSIKLALNDTFGAPISQFEYTWAAGKVSYDLSNIDGNPDAPDGYPFAQGGMVVNPSMSDDPANPTCVPVDCPAGTLVCSAAYNAPDDPRTMVCNEEADLALTLCPGGSSKKRAIYTHKHGQQRRHIGHPHARR